MITDGAGGRAAFCGLAASLVIGLGACGSAVAGASGATKPGGAAQLAAAGPAATHANPGAPATMPKRLLLCLEVPRLTRMSVTPAPLPPYRVAREELPGELTVLCALPAMPELSHVFRGSFRALSPLP
jgi:hypothetical protein